MVQVKVGSPVSEHHLRKIQKAQGHPLRPSNNVGDTKLTEQEEQEQAALLQLPEQHEEQELEHSGQQGYHAIQTHVVFTSHP